MGARVVEGLKHALPPPDPKDQAAQAEVAEQAGRTISRRWETMGQAVRKQGRRVMELLRKAAARVVPASREMPGLANGLTAVVGDGSAGERGASFGS